MTEENQTDPPWKTKLREALLEALDAYLSRREAGLMDGEAAEVVLKAVLPRMETSYRAGRMAGASQAGYRLVQKNLELAKKLREIREAIDFSRAATYSLERIVDILGEDSP